MIKELHPYVEIIWNFWPFNSLFWAIFKVPANGILFFFWIFSVPFYYVWNFIPDTIGFTMWFISFNILTPSFGLMLFFGGSFWLLTWLFCSSLPDLYWGTALLATLIGIIGGLTGGSFDFEKLGKDAWLTPPDPDAVDDDAAA